MNLGKGKWGRPRRPDVCGALQLPTSPLWQAGHDTVRRPKPRTVRVPGPEGGPGPEEGVRGRRRPARRAVRPAYPERGGAGAGRSRRRGRSRLQEPLETESPAAAVVTGGAHRQASGHRAAGADSFHHLQPENGGPREVLLSQIIYTLTQSVEWLLDTRNLRRPCPL
ncbi:guanine nucleotide-binding protein G(I)/G(S)/G(O) subunit gamma-12 isoform X2 [Zalophus californianus]|uniref:Guanine nucleotide-binding protein G(I)/G(S)/G(O) subunit gamma-12 isoform X2 n=1 Tax=Zalophus californianus TaxID=9704 RepID=A0A6J2EL19_ZALCA|nr:guanine nucleotide-binding protein G(I)/G(S)/G(O) subunit gamma-12 isoform X2 [Zalophus californianus]XP_027467577.1 guanine nucleotide-binding protein G(I)/G(S)/G(O) subunit gamma-12 isoform X2 [Zalophus californianus]